MTAKMKVRDAREEIKIQAPLNGAEHTNLQGNV